VAMFWALHNCYQLLVAICFCWMNCSFLENAAVRTMMMEISRHKANLLRLCLRFFGDHKLMLPAEEKNVVKIEELAENWMKIVE